MNTAKEYFESSDEKSNISGSLKYIPLLNDVIDNNLYTGHIENFLGLSMMPIGLTSKLYVRGEFARGSFNIPLATTEGALVASYNRGIKASRLSGGIVAKVLEEKVQRSPLFKFNNLQQSLDFTSWVIQKIDIFKTIIESKSRFAKLLSINPLMEGNELILQFNYKTGDASGQNMITISTQAVCEFILEYAPVKPQHWYIESNASGDKKSGGRNLSHCRGKKVIAELELSEMIVKNVLKSTPGRMVNYWQSSTMSQVKMGNEGNQGHIANGLTALFIATGQDVACISEAAYGVNRMEINGSGGLYASLCLPNLLVGTVGGGTSLPTQRECLEIMECYGNGKSGKFAEICTALALAGELSIAAAIAEGHFSRAHEKLGRK